MWEWIWSLIRRKGRGKRTVLVTTVERVLHLVHESRHDGSVVFVLRFDSRWICVWSWLEVERLIEDRGKSIVQSWMRMRVRKKGGSGVFKYLLVEEIGK